MLPISIEPDLGKSIVVVFNKIKLFTSIEEPDLGNSIEPVTPDGCKNGEWIYYILM